MDFIAGACELIGKLVVGNKNRGGFLIQICGSAFWIYVAVTHRLWGLLGVTIGCVVANLRNYRKWGKEAGNVR